MSFSTETIKQSVEGTAHTREEREQVRSFEEQEAAFLNVFGEWKTTIGRGQFKDEVSVRPLSTNDISILGAAIARAVHEKESQVLNKLTHEDKVQGDKVREATLSTQVAVSGETQFFNELFLAIRDGLQSKTPEIFVIAPAKVAEYINERHAIDTEGTQLDPTATGTDPSTHGVDTCFVLTPNKGAELEKIFKNNGQTTKTLTTCDGFQVRLGGIRLAFFYSGGHAEHVAKEKAVSKPANDNAVEDKPVQKAA